MTIALKTLGQPKTAPEALLETLFRPMGIDGVYGRTGRYEDVVDGLSALISRHRPDRAEIFRFPPVVSRAMIEKSGYLKSFPHLLGCVCALQGGEREIGAAVDRFVAGEDWTGALKTADLVLAPAACYPVYPLAAARGALPAEGYVFDVACDCFRREPSRDIDRLQSFRMREFVRIGTPDQVRAFRQDWMTRATAIAETLGLVYRVEAASDPFFGRGGVLVSKAQAQQELKFELVVPVRSAEKPTACMSFNYHRDHFGQTWAMKTEAGEAAHTACVAFGMDRLAVALFATHGIDPAQWPKTVRQALAL
ncbi:MAG TPA: amino acid--[acyl-carrier-protein] ligase [Roseiarcus sp.]|nr:amino acid--[acyl-carrier-protein] ligase [Roseiarcus sp.]